MNNGANRSRSQSMPSGESPSGGRGRPAAIRRAAALAATAAASALAPSRSLAANDAWSTAPANGNFSGVNWTTGTNVPGAATGTAASGDNLTFGTSTVTLLNNDQSGFNFTGLTFNAGASAFNVSGNAFTLNGTIANNGTNLQIVNDAIALGANETVNAAAGQVSLGGAVTGAFVLTATGPNAITLGGTGNSLSGLTIGTSITANTNNNTVITGESGVTLNLTNAQSLGAILVGTGANVINVGANAAITTTTLAQAGSNDRFDILNVNLASGASMTTNATNTNGVIAINAQFNVLTLNGTDFATNSTNAAGGTVMAAAYTNSTATVVGGTSANPTINTTVVTDATLAANNYTNTLRFADTTGHTVTLGAFQLAIAGATNSGGGGAILMAANSGAITNTITGGTLTGSSNRGLALLNYDTTSGANLQVNSNFNNYVVGGSGSSGTADLEVAGGGKVTLGGVNLINGITYVDGSTLSVGSDSNLGGTNGTVSVTTATIGSTAVTLTSANTNTSGLAVGDVLLGQVISAIASNGLSTSVTLAANYAGTSGISTATTVGFAGGGAIALNGGTLMATSNFSLSETATTAQDTTLGLTVVRNRNIGLGLKGGSIDVTGSNTLTVPGVISGSGPLTKTDSGTLNLTNGNTYTGVTSISAGTLTVAQFAGITASPTITVANGATFNTSAKGTTGFNVLAAQSVLNNGTVTGSLTAAGTVVDNGTISGQVTVNAGGVLAGTGTAASAYVTGGTITAGSGASSLGLPGTLTTTVAQNWSSGSFVDKVTSTTGGPGVGNDLLVMSTLNITGAFTLNVLTSNGSSPSLAPGAVLVLADDNDTSSANPFNSSAPAYATLTSNLTLVVNGAAPSGLTYGTQADTTGNGGFDLILQSTAAAPEPTSLLLAGLAAVPLTLGRRRRRWLA